MYLPCYALAPDTSTLGRSMHKHTIYIYQNKTSYLLLFYYTFYFLQPSLKWYGIQASGARYTENYDGVLVKRNSRPNGTNSCMIHVLFWCICVPIYVFDRMICKVRRTNQRPLILSSFGHWIYPFRLAQEKGENNNSTNLMELCRLDGIYPQRFG